MNTTARLRLFLPPLALGCLLLMTGCGERKEAAPPRDSAAPGRPPPAPPEQPKPQVEAPAEQKPATVSTLAAYYHLDETRGAATVADKVGRHEGRPNDGASLGVDGQVRGAADFSGARGGQIMVAEPLNLFTNTVTLAAWVKRRGPQRPGAALVFCRGGEVVSGLQVGGGNELDYVWNRAGKSAWKSGLALPDGQWAFVALVVAPAQATMYLGLPGQPLRSAVNDAPHEVAEFSGALTLGRDPIVGIGFEGALDEVGIWRNAMSAADVGKLYVVGQKLGAAGAVAEQAAEPRTPEAGGSEYERAVALYNNAVDAYRNFLQTRRNPAVLKQIEDNMRACIAVFERSKARPPAGSDPQGMIDRCNKMIFDCHAAKQITP